jgi:hypothetical protein
VPLVDNIRQLFSRELASGDKKTVTALKVFTYHSAFQAFARQEG